ncbi:7108_t:CDS:1, partial [Gigaspora margarita]
DKNNIKVDVVKTIWQDAFDEQALITMTAPIKFHRDMDPTSGKYL